MAKFKKIQIRHSVDGALPENVTLACIHEDHRGPGWYCITPGSGIAHGPWTYERCLFTVKGWLHNFRNDLEFWAIEVHPADRDN